MSQTSVNSPLSLQESQLLHILLQHAAYWTKTQGIQMEGTTAGQILPPGTNTPAIASDNADLSPQNIHAAFLALQTQDNAHRGAIWLDDLTLADRLAAH